MSDFSRGGDCCPFPPTSSVFVYHIVRMNISRFSELSTTQVFNLKSIDRNADQEFQVIGMKLI